jgi:hypothetical protein
MRWIAEPIHGVGTAAFCVNCPGYCPEVCPHYCYSVCFKDCEFYVCTGFT